MKPVKTGGLAAVILCLMSAPMWAGDKPAGHKPASAPPGAVRGQTAPYNDVMSDTRLGTEFGAPQKQVELGDNYRNGRGMAKDKVRAAAWYRAAVNQGYAPAQTALGVMYAAGDGVAQDYGAARDLLQKAADQGYGPAQLALGGMYAKGQGAAAADPVEAYRWLQLATLAGTADGDYAGYVRARDEVARTLTPAQIAQAKALATAWKPAARTVDQQVADALDVFEDGDDVKAMALLAPLAEGGNTLAQALFGAAQLMMGEDKPDQGAKGVTWLRSAAEKGNPGAQLMMGGLYLKGQGVSQDLSAAAGWMQKAADQEVDVAEYTVGMMYLYGKGMPRDQALARTWLQKAADQGYGSAQMLLAGYYTQPPEDKVLAYKWLALSAICHRSEEDRAASRKAVTEFAAEMTPAQIAKAKTLVASWQPVYPLPK